MPELSAKDASAEAVAAIAYASSHNATWLWVEEKSTLELIEMLREQRKRREAKARRKERQRASRKKKPRTARAAARWP